MNKFEKLLKEKEFVFLDGALGTMLQSKDFELGKVPELLNITNPEGVIGIHREYIEAGSDIIYSCSFGVNEHKLKGTGYTVEEVITAAVKNAKKATVGTDTLVALDIGPLGMMLEPNGNVSFEDAYDMFALQIKAGAEAGADLIAIETMTDLYEIKAALLAAKETCNLPVIFGVLTTNNFDQAFERAGGKLANKGEEYAITAIRMIDYARSYER